MVHSSVNSSETPISSKRRSCQNLNKRYRINSSSWAIRSTNIRSDKPRLNCKKSNKNILRPLIPTSQLKPIMPSIDNIPPRRFQLFLDDRNSIESSRENESSLRERVIDECHKKMCPFTLDDHLLETSDAPKFKLYPRMKTKSSLYFNDNILASNDISFQDSTIVTPIKDHTYLRPQKVLPSITRRDTGSSVSSNCDPLKDQLGWLHFTPKRHQESNDSLSPPPLIKRLSLSLNQMNTSIDHLFMPLLSPI